MRILKIKISGLDLFKEGLEINWLAQQNVTEDNNQGLHSLFSNIFTHNVLSIIGINASGKTTVLKVVTAIMDIFLANEKLNSSQAKEVLIGKNIMIETYYYSDSKNIIKLQSYIDKNKENELCFSEEILWQKKSSSVKSKNKLFEFDQNKYAKKRSLEDHQYLADDISIFIAEIKQEKIKIQIHDFIRFTNFNFMGISGEIPVEVISFLDPSIEYVKVSHKDNDYKKSLVQLKFTQQKQPVEFSNLLDLDKYLSSGTIKGLNMFAYIYSTLKNSGYLIVDEIENHFNKSIVRTIIELFRNPKVNPHGAMLIFSTHYPELLDDFDRNDSIYITKKTDTLTLTNLSQLLKRNDLKKSEVYQSDYLEGTAPKYNAYINLKESISKHATEV